MARTCIPLCSNCDLSVSVDASLRATEDIIQYIREGQIPSDSSSRTHTAAADAAESQICNLDRVLKRLNALTEEVKAHRDRLSDFAEQQRAVTAPVRRIPTELWQQIFLYACAGTTLACPLKPHMLTALSLSHVCRAWWAIARHGAGLWAPRLKFDVGRMLKDVTKGRNGKEVHEYRLAAAFHLNRSRAEPFSFDVIWECDGKIPDKLEEYLEDVHLLLMMLADSFTRWKDCSIAGSALDYMIYHDLYFRIPDLLESCSIVGWMREQDLIEELFMNAPRLTRWTQEYVGFAPELPFSQLTHVKTGRVHSSFVARILSSCEALEVLDISIIEIDQARLDLPSHVVIPRLQELSLAGHNTLVLSTVLRRLEAPALSHLMLGSIHRFVGFEESVWKSLFDSEDFRSFEDRTPGFSLSVDDLEDDRVYELLESS
ncbi:uncharacterized protein SCHCODRAFT_02617551 [Schizophyllum commune H4-8]|nr:uncharacterized protein SCHCODRAFT_02617551 [Schizophyllum commune H4-8]KAI5894677.1 hypothetical protein SCHCODRAFT_02617551 [Schizophyllum commune H4-8]